MVLEMEASTVINMLTAVDVNILKVALLVCAKKDQKYFAIRILDIIKKDEVESLNSMVQFS